ncbi:MAG: NFACT family protein [Clostridia bacterium]|nr:NFACT family protein [Clostridia bacterium]
MPMDGLTLRAVAGELNSTLLGGRVDRVTQPERDEIIITIRNRGENHALLITTNANSARLNLTWIKKNNPLEPPAFCMILRKRLTGGRVSDVRLINGDRIVEIDFNCVNELGDDALLTLVCEFMGKHSNIILTHSGGKIIDCARRVTEDISSVREVLPGLIYERPPEHGKLPFDDIDEKALAKILENSSGALSRAIAANVSGLSRQTAAEICERAALDRDARAGDVNPDVVASRISAFLSDTPFAPEIVYDQDMPFDVTAFPYGIYSHMRREKFETISQAVDIFYKKRDQAYRMTQKSSALRRVIKNNIERCEKKLALQLEALEGSANMEKYRVKGEMLTASLAGVKKGAKSVRLVDYYDPECREIEIELDEKLTPAQNAQRYFKLYQKARSAQKLASEQIEKTREELDYLDGQLFNLDECDEEAQLNEIREELEKLGYVNASHNRRQIKKLPPSKPLHYRIKGVDILVGRNNVQNDRLTQSAQPDEIWLHAKDIPGSHVIILSQSPDEGVLLAGALLAAKHSKSGQSSSVPVDYTKKRYVKKPSGAKPGFVIYTHQKTLFVTPAEEAMSEIELV